MDQGNGSNTYQASVFNTTNLVNQDPASSTTASFNINTGKLILKGGSITTTETGASQVNGAFLDYVIYAPNFTSALSTGTLQLTQTGGPDASGNRTFALTTGTTNLISLVPSAATGYVISVSYHATFQNGGVGAPNRVNDQNPGVTGSGYNATFNVDGTLTPAPTVMPANIQVGADGNPGSPYYFPNTGASPQFPGTTFTSSTNAGGVSGAFDINSGQLRILNTTVNTSEAGANVVTSVVLYYRTRLTTSGGGAYQPITLTQSGSLSNGSRTFVIDPASTTNTNAQPNLIATPAVTAAGNYIVDVYYQANGYNSSSGTTFTVTYPPSGFFSAGFSVAGTPIATTIWTGATNDNWFDVTNWSNGVPTATTNALIRDLGAGNSVPYPNVNSGVVVTTISGAVLYDNTNSGPAMVLNLTMGGSSQASRSITRLVKGQLKVYGDFSNLYDSFVQRENTIMEFAGVNQTISGGSFVRLDISGGGNKALSGIMNISESLNFLTPNVYTAPRFPLTVNPTTATSPNAGLLTTDITKPTISVVVLADRAATNFNSGAQLNGETNDSYLFGFSKTTRQAVLAGETRTYGNMGLTITFTNGNNPDNVDVTRNTVEAYSPINNRYGIRRIFGVRPANQQTNSGGLQAKMIFHFLDRETINLGGTSTITPGSQSIPKSRLVMFVSTNSGNTFSYIGRDVPVDETNNLVTASNIRTFATFTLGDKDNPLPVRLTAFDAKRIGTDALVSWQTASELNSRGYDVQVSTNGTEFRTLSSIPSVAPNSVHLTSYSYIDTEKNKTGTRYYRLRQVDLDGKETFFTPVAVNFEGKASATTLVAYPNPFNSNDELHVALQSATAGKGQLLITDLTGRTIRNETVEVSVGLTDFAVNNTAGLQAGMYLVKFMLPTGEVKNLKVQKQ